MKINIVNPLLDYKKISPQIFKGIEGIPLEPKIPLKNYLIDLVARSDGKESSIYLKGVEKFIQEVWAEMVKNNWKTLRVRQFMPEKLGVQYAMLYAYKNGKKAISIPMMCKLLQLWKIYCQRNEQDVERKWNKIYKSDFSFSIHKGFSPTKLPKYISPRLSYLIGFICGDGHFTDYGNHYLIKISEKSTNQLNCVLKPLFQELFDINVPIFQVYEGGYALQAGNKPIFRFLTKVLEIKVGEIPEIAKNLDPINKKYFLIGLFDSEGTLNPIYLDGKVVIYQSNYKFLEEVIDLFEDLGLRFMGPYRHHTNLGIWYDIQIRKKADILKFIKEIGTCHIDKFQKIKKLEQELYAHGYCYSTT